MRHTYYRTCPICGSNLDPGEQCECEQKGRERHADDGSGEGSAEGLQKEMERSEQGKAA